MVAVDSAGDLFIADGGNNVVREVVKATGDIITVAGTGTPVIVATAARDRRPTGSSRQPRRRLGGRSVHRRRRQERGARGRESDRRHHHRRRRGTAGYSGDSGPATAAQLDEINGLAVDSVGDLFIADYGDNMIREVVKATGDIITVAGTGTAGYTGDSGPATAAEFNLPSRVAVDSAGDLFVADYRNNVVREITSAATVIIGGTSSSPGTAASITATAGTHSSAAVDTAFATAFQAVVDDQYGNPVSGVSVTFTAPTSGAGGNFAGSTTTTVTTNSSGVATAPAFTANTFRAVTP